MAPAFSMELRRRLANAMLALVALGAIATSGYIALGDNVSFLQALYMFVTTIATVGYGEIVDTSHSAALRTFNLVVILFGWAISAYVLASLTTFLVEGEITNIFWRRKMQKQISELKHHYVVCGLGDTGRHAIEELQKTGTPFVAVEAREDVVKRLREHESGAYKDMLIIMGDATDETVLEEANVSQAKGLIAALSNEKDNLVITVMVRQRHNHMRIVARCTDPKFGEKLVKAGANSTVSPNMIGGMRMASEVLRPHVVSFLDSMLKQQGQTVRVEEIELAENSPWVGKTFASLNLRHNFNVLAMAIREPGHGKSGGYTVNPQDGHELHKGSVLIVLGDVHDIHKAREHALHAGMHVMGAHS
jgi:voltage-gated potassium channel